MKILDAILSFAAAFVPEAKATALASAAPGMLTVDAARQNIAAARVAGATYGVDPALLLSIARFESGYRWRTITAEPQGKVSCGVMTPIPTWSRRVCQQHTSSLLAGYMAGAEHVAAWARRCKAIGRPGLRCTLISYAGGGLLRRACDRAWLPVCGRAYTKRARLAERIRAEVAP